MEDKDDFVSRMPRGTRWLMHPAIEYVSSGLLILLGLVYLFPTDLDGSDVVGWVLIGGGALALMLDAIRLFVVRRRRAKQ
ncbi:hypothetical protein ACFSBZ_05915 [Amnibacterium flavum]|uniref:YrhK domain-containing protein n=1 Tax=Amnibacterium flavum TaxID=2173173 RepID=A0A2V1HN19_9MICO|nr:hypothetical protein [Amnibacterium flavum]PVZ93996.1 hypothetical protein DDQ50_09565 [Amnibacterium flavum]